MKMEGGHDEDTTAATDIGNHQGLEGYGQKGEQLDMRYIVGVTETSEVLGRFETEQEASEFIGTLPEHADGRYYLDGPVGDYQSPQGFSGKRMGSPSDGAGHSGSGRGGGLSGKGNI